MPGELGEALRLSPPFTADRANGQECHRCPKATLILFFLGVDTQGICMRPAHPPAAAVGQQILELLQCPAWPGTGAGQALPAMLPPCNPSSCQPSQQCGQGWPPHTNFLHNLDNFFRQFFIWLFSFPYSFLLSLASPCSYRTRQTPSALPSFQRQGADPHLSPAEGADFLAG